MEKQKADSSREERAVPRSSSTGSKGEHGLEGEALEFVLRR
jgi:hypothetical protein